MEKLKYGIDIDIKNIKTFYEDEKKYFSFEYTVEINGVLHKDFYKSDFSGVEFYEFEKILKSHYAIEIIFENLYKYI